MTKTQLFGKIDFNIAALKDDLATIECLPLQSAHIDYACGDWRSCVLYDVTDNAEDALSTDDEEALVRTQMGNLLPYITSLIETCFDVQRLRYACLFHISNYGLIIPHRDCVDLEDGCARLHLVIETHDKCFFSDEDTVFRMRQGEVWCLDASRIHSAATLSVEPCIHLVLDFEPGESVADLLMPEIRDKTVQPQLVERPPFNKAAEARIMAMAGIVDLHTLPDLVSIITKHHFTHAIEAAEVHDVLIELCKRSGNEAALQNAEALRNACLFNRPDSTTPYAAAAE